MARSCLGLRGTPACGLPQQTSRVAAVSHFAAPQGWRGPVCVCVGPQCAGSPSSPRKWRQFHTSQPPRDGE
eukprot:8856996-Pyramimonas_sp.AAC.1